jgi:6-pyruvoyltetrahydropterin/6-carboxytetrahydropterin synthase
MPRFKLNVKFNFASSHFLTKYHGKCEELHGHNYKLIVQIEDEIKEDGMVMDYKIIKKIVNEEAIKKLDHKHLNNILENPSTENLLILIWDLLKEKLPLKKLTIYETENYYAEYEG